MIDSVLMAGMPEQDFAGGDWVVMFFRSSQDHDAFAGQLAGITPRYCGHNGKNYAIIPIGSWSNELTRHPLVKSWTTLQGTAEENLHYIVVHHRTKAAGP